MKTGRRTLFPIWNIRTIELVIVSCHDVSFSLLDTEIMFMWINNPTINNISWNRKCTVENKEWPSYMVSSSMKWKALYFDSLIISVKCLAKSNHSHFFILCKISLELHWRFCTWWLTCQFKLEINIQKLF